MLVVNGTMVKSKVGDTVLQALESNNIQIFIGCRSGICGACRCKKVKGDVALVTEPLAFANEDELIACVSLIPEHGDLEIQC